ncbi:MAG: hypothetical protein L3K07_05945 [Thermoplasmata archaeon]|nr:hypothetical protein [Thermoplasmata archaeon]
MRFEARPGARSVRQVQVGLHLGLPDEHSLSAGTGPAIDPDPTRLILTLFVVGTLLAVAVGYLGITNQLGGSIPGTLAGHGGSSPTCEGRNVTGSYHFLLIAGQGGNTNFNGTSPGPCLVVGVGSAVVVTLRVDPGAGANHSWDLIPSTGPTNVTPVFPGAGVTGPTRFSGLPPGTVTNFSFNATVVGLYRYVCEVDDHSTLGMMGTLNVTNVLRVAAHGTSPLLQPLASIPGRTFLLPSPSFGGRYMTGARWGPRV